MGELQQKTNKVFFSYNHCNCMVSKQLNYNAFICELFFFLSFSHGAIIATPKAISKRAMVAERSEFNREIFTSRGAEAEMSPSR